MEYYGNDEVKRVRLVYKNESGNKDQSLIKMEKYLIFSLK